MMNYGSPRPLSPPRYPGPPEPAGLSIPDDYDRLDASLFLGAQRSAPKRRPAPKLEQVRRDVDRVRRLNALRNATIQIRRDLVALATIASKASRSRQTNSDRDDFIMKLSWPDTVLQEAVNSFGAIEISLYLEADDSTEEAEEAAERPVALMGRLDELLEDEFAANGGPQPLFMAMAQYAMRDGIVVQKMCRRPRTDEGTGNIWDFELIDPMEVYPDPVGGRFSRFYRVSMVTVADVRAVWGENLLPEREPEDDVEQVAYYDDYWHGVYLSDEDDDWLKKPSAHGYDHGVPLAIHYFRGTTGSRGDRTGARSAEEIEASRGRGIFDAVVDEMAEFARLQTMLIDKAMLATRPPLTAKLQPGSDTKINRNPNSISYLGPEESVDKLPQDNLDLQYITQLQQGIVASLENATLPLNVLARTQSGFQMNLGDQRAQKFFVPFIKGLKLAHRWRYRAGLLLFRQFGDEMDVSGESVRGKRFTWTITPDQIPPNPRVIVEFSDLNPIDKVQMMTAAAGLANSGFMDVDTLYGPHVLKFPNPSGIKQRIREDQMWKNPALVDAMAPAMTAQILEEALKDALKRGHEMQAAILGKQLKTFFTQFMSDTPVVPPPGGAMGGPPPLGPGGPPMPPQIPPPGGLMGPPPPDLGQMGPQMPPGGQIPPELAAIIAMNGGGSPQGGPPMQGPPPNLPMPGANVLPPDLLTGNQVQLTPEILRQRAAGRVGPGFGQG